MILLLLMIDLISKMKTSRMKKLFISLSLSLSLSAGAQTVFTNFDNSSGNRSQETCWGFGGFSLTNRIDRDPSATYWAKSGSLNTNKNSFWLKSPFVNLQSGNITFKTRIDRFDGSNVYKVFIDFIEFDANDTWGEGNVITGSVYTMSEPTNKAQSVSIAVPSAIANNTNPYKVYLRFESTNGNRNKRALVDEVSIPGTFASDPSNNCKPVITVADSDLDSVRDDVDEYPNDANAVYDLFSPAADVDGLPIYGTIAYEDLWPAKGDYDFNDLVLDYSTRYTFNANAKATRIQYKFSVRALGGDLIKGFGVHFNGVASNRVNAVNGNSLTTGNISNASNGTENGQSNAVVIACDDVEQIINRVGGAFFNSISSNAKGTSDTITIDISFTTGLSSSELEDISIFAFKQRDQEIHMVNKSPTDLVDVSLFGTSDDASDPASGQYYKTSSNHPWAIQVSESFDYPEEKADIVQAYLNFANWAQSNGANSTDWYTDQSSNRQASNIYQ